MMYPSITLLVKKCDCWHNCGPNILDCMDVTRPSPMHEAWAYYQIEINCSMHSEKVGTVSGKWSSYIQGYHVVVLQVFEYLLILKLAYNTLNERLLCGQPSQVVASVDANSYCSYRWHTSCNTCSYCTIWSMLRTCLLKSEIWWKL